MTKESLEKKYEIAFEQAAALQPIFPEAAKREMAQMVEVIARGNENIRSELQTNRRIEQKGGYIAEEFHAETFNLDSIYNESDARAITDRYKQDWQEQGLSRNDNPDVVIVEEGKITTKSQLKYEKTAKKTAGKLSQKNADGSVKYGQNDSYIVPKDQKNEVKNYSKQRSVEKANAGDAELAESFKQTSEKTTDTLSDGKATSKPLSKKEANELGKGNLDKLKEIESDYQTASTLKQMGNAAVGAAAMSAVVSGSVNTLKYIQLANSGELTAEEATVKILGETAAAAADSAVKASANAGVQSLMVRYGTEEAAMQVLAQQGMKNMLKTNAVTVGVTCAVDAVKDLVRLGTGQISTQEFFDRQGKGVLMTSAGVAGSALGTAAGAGIATTLGLSSGTLAVTVLEFIGGMSGGMIAGLAMALAIENGIEKPYRDLVRNTENLKAAACELERVSRNVFRSQILFTKYLEADYRLEKELQTQMDRVDEAGQRAFEAISKI
ncbi:MAG: hypothetical protein HDR50_02470 [Desulfovibrio sp.]|uniref:hypothetical protein n=1 Tax=Desulfovibrio sp. TaxID=885 RepID=UPI001A6E8B1E|nr:hypothetical protein [Desulfovibrio sp.]MBD5416539.1 hypothetical protein [Desulfovibrio sp.]